MQTQSWKCVAAAEDEKSKTTGNSDKARKVSKRGRKTGPEAKHARPTTYESGPWIGRAGWRAQPSLRCTAVGYEVATCDLIRFGKSKTPPEGGREA